MTQSVHSIGRPSGRALRFALMTGCAAAIWSMPAMAQDDAGEESASEAIVITGSRIQRRDYTATSPIVTVDSDLLEKSSSINLEANLNKLPQFAPAVTQFINASGRGDIQANANNTLGATTVALRQLGSNRNLVLIDGRRGTPINGTGVVDINSIPSAAIDRVEVITGGASSTYGADAVGGVVNFILKKNFQGLNIDGQIGTSQWGDGTEWRISGLFGANLDGDRGNVMFGMEYYDRQLIELFDRSYYRELYASPDRAGNTIFGMEQDYVSWVSGANPAQAVLNAQFNPPSGLNVPVTSPLYINDGGSTLYTNTSTGTGAAYTPLVLGYEGTADGIRRKYTVAGLLTDNYLDQLLSTPLTRYSFFARGRFDFNDWISAFGQASMVKTKVVTRNLVPPAVGSWGTYIPHGSGIYQGNEFLGIPSSLNADGSTNALYRPGGQFGLSCGATGGCTNSQVFPVPMQLATILDSRTVARNSSPVDGPETDAAYAARLAAMGCGTLPAGVAPGAPGSGANCNFQINKYLTQVGKRYTDNQNVTFQLLAGFEGRIPGTDWTWEAYVSHGETNAKTDQYNFASVDRWRYLLGSPNYGYNFSHKGNSYGPGGGFQGATGTCASGVNPFTTPEWTPDCRDAVKLDLQNDSRVVQNVVETNLQGGLFDLPYGQLRAAIGASYRENSIRFKTDSMTTEGSAWFESVNGVYPQGNTNGAINAKEVYGELLVPLLSNMPGAEILNLELGYRLSDYNTVGTVSTYKINGEWAPIRWLRFRGGYQKASRAPNLGELFTARTSTLGTANDGDPCSRANPANPNGLGNYSANPDLNPDAAQVEGLCRQIMGATGAAQYYRDGRDYSTVTFGFSFPALTGNPDLSEETAKTYTIGGVITSPFESPWLSRLRLSLDYYNVVLENAIAQGGVDAVYRRCFAKQYNPDYEFNVFCSLVGRYPDSGEVQSVGVTYANAGRVETDGFDLQLNWALSLRDGGIGLPGTFMVNIQGTYLNHFKTTTDDGIIPLVDYAGTLGGGDVGTNAGSYRWKLFTTFSYTTGPVTASLQWQHKPPAKSPAYAANPDTAVTGAPAYDLFNLAGTVSVMRIATIRFGVDNLFNREPPLIGVNTAAAGTTLPGGSFDASQYDVLGRRFYIGASLKF